MIMDEEIFDSEILGLISKLDDEAKVVIKRIIETYEDTFAMETTYKLVNDFIMVQQDNRIQLAFSSTAIDDAKGLFTHMIKANKVELINGKVHSEEIDEVPPIFLVCENKEEYKDKLNKITKKITTSISDFIAEMSGDRKDEISIKEISSTEDNIDIANFLKQAKEEKSKESITNKTSNTIDLDKFRYRDKTDSKYKN